MNTIDPHHHLWREESRNYPWMQADESVDVIWGKPVNLPRNYLTADLLDDFKNQNVVKSVHVQCEHDPSRPVEETKWLQAVADAPGSGGFPHGIVGFANFAQPDIEEVLEGHCQYPNIRGIRQILNVHENPRFNHADRDYLKDPLWRKNFSLLSKYNLSFDLQLYYHQMDGAASLARENPDILFILNHTGMPADRDDESIRNWRKGMQTLADCPNIIAKISGLAMCDWHWTVESIRPFVLNTIEDFGVERCMFASNFPVDKLHSSFDAVWNAFKEITTLFSDQEKAALFLHNAEKYYRL